MTLQNPLTHSNRIESRQITTRSIELRHLGDLFRIAYYVDINPHLLSRSLNILMSIRIEITKKRAHVTQQYEAVSYWSSRTGDVSRTPPGMLLSHPLLKFSPCDEQESLVAGEGSNKKGFFLVPLWKDLLEGSSFSVSDFWGVLGGSSQDGRK